MRKHSPIIGFVIGLFLVPLGYWLGGFTIPDNRSPELLWFISFTLGGGLYCAALGLINKS